MKKIIKLPVILAFSVLGIFSSCTDLSETIYSSIAAEKTTFSSEDIKNMIAPAYSNLRNIYWGWNGMFDLYEESSDLMMTPYRVGIGWGDLYITMHKHTYHSYVDHFYTNWYYAYNGIDNINKVLDLKSDAVTAYEPELRGLRALYYYILLDNFRNVPLETTMDHESGYLPTQADPQKVFDFIVSELDSVKNDLGTDVSTANYGHFNKYAACMTLAKIYLNYNAWFGTSDNTYYQKAINEVNTIINDGKYSLAPNYTDPFVDDASSCPEVIFAIPFDYTYASGNYLASKCLYSASAATFGLTISPWDGSCAIPQFIDTYDPDDKRLGMTWLVGQQYALNGDSIYINKVPMVYTKAVHSIDNPGAYPLEGARFHKYKIYSGKVAASGDDVPFFRYTDALMIKAECLLRLGGYNGETEQDAANIVTSIRARAFTTNPTKATRTVAQLKGPSVYAYGHSENQGELGKADVFVTSYEGGADIELGGFLDDLAWEFVGEHHRRQDLIRFRVTSNGMNVYNGKSWFCKDAETNASDTHKNIFPIYQDFIDANKNMKQNTGY
jgi:starch-binding outer membrane protein, SusD/RagB family